MGDVRFNFAGALHLARSFWALAGEVESAQTARATAALTAQKQWQGTYRTQFDERLTTENVDARNLAEKCRMTANKFAEAWVRAKTEQFSREWAREKEKKQAEKAWNDSLHDWAFGDDRDYGAPKPPPLQPVPPSFSA